MIGSSVSASQPVTSAVPQGSVLGPLLFILYLAPLEDVITSHGLDFMLYAGDSDLYIAVNPCGRQSAIANLEHCISDVLTACVHHIQCVRTCLSELRDVSTAKC